MPAQSWSWGVWFLKLEFDIFVLLKPWKHYVITKPTHFFSTVTKLFIIFSKTCQISQILDIIFTIVLNYKWSHHSYCHSNSKKGTTLIIGDIQIWFISIPFKTSKIFSDGKWNCNYQIWNFIRFFWLLVFILLITVSYTDRRMCDLTLNFKHHTNVFFQKKIWMIHEIEWQTSNIPTLTFKVRGKL